MEKLFIVVEGDADVSFIGQVIKFKFQHHTKDIKFIKAETNGSSIGDNKLRTIATDTNKLAYNTLFILDADAPDLLNTKVNLTERFEQLGMSISAEKLFLLPNNSEDGCLENLLLDMVIELKSEEIFRCFDEYKSCLLNKNPAYFPPQGLKPKIFAYVDVLTGQGGEQKRNYGDPNVWNLNSHSLDPLINFLNTHLAS